MAVPSEDMAAAPPGIQGLAVEHIVDEDIQAEADNMVFDFVLNIPDFEFELDTHKRPADFERFRQRKWHQAAGY